MEPIKIKIKLTPLQLSAICCTLIHLQYEPAPTRAEQVKRSIMNVAANKLLKKQIDTPKKEFSLTLAFHEADMLEIFLRQWAENEEQEFTRRLIYKVADAINQKLA